MGKRNLGQGIDAKLVGLRCMHAVYYWALKKSRIPYSGPANLTSYFYFYWCPAVAILIRVSRSISRYIRHINIYTI